MAFFKIDGVTPINAENKIAFPFSTLTRGFVEDKMRLIIPCSEEGQNGRDH